MTSDAVSAGGDPRRLLADVRELARRVRLTQRVTWLPLLVLGVLTLGAIPVYRFGHQIVSDCRTLPDGGRVCHVEMVAAEIYWALALAAGYVVIATVYLRVARSRGVEARVLPYVFTGVGLVVLFSFAVRFWVHLDPPPDLGRPPAAVEALYRLVDVTGTFGLALLVLAWLERHVALLVFALGYLVVVVAKVNLGWGDGWGSRWQFAPMLAITGGLLLLGSAGFALAQRRAR
ncbi:hypothetical protein [Dactylosporangium sp. NPDC049140]|uniref:hypothetical protein n=1 Tax=Dactylosporangium sp. NPDC049140 TaxID=3155647 RepID=UPI0033CD0214